MAEAAAEAVRTAVVAEAAAMRAEDLQAVERMPVLRARPLEAADHMPAARAQAVAVTAARTGGIHFIAVPPGAQVLQATVVQRRDRTPVPSALRAETIPGRTRLRPLRAHLET
jgi:RES domain-containing protein